jgi:hypothetical protein
MQLEPAVALLRSWWADHAIESVDTTAAEPLAESPCDALAQSPLSSRFAALYGIAPAPSPAADPGAAARQARADELASKGGPRAPAPQPPATQKELDDLAAAVNAADDDAAVRIANDPRAMALATPEQKAALIRKLSDGHTNGDEEAAIKKILMGCTSREEMDKVIQLSGGIQAIADELDAGDLQDIGNRAVALTQTQNDWVLNVLLLLEQASSPQEFEALYAKLGGDTLKHALRLRDGSAESQRAFADAAGRFEALGRRHGVPGVGFGMPPEKAAGLQAQIEHALAEGDNDAIVKLSENSDAMKLASPAQKARMISILQDGWTKDSQDMAIARILTSCGSKEEFDQVVDLAGGPKILDDVDFDEAKADINKMMGGFDRLDCADDPALAQAYRGTMMPPLVDELTRTRPPGAEEAQGVLGPDPWSAADRRDPALADANRRMDAERSRAAGVAYDVQSDPLARNKLAMKNRERQLEGLPPLDHTALVTEAYRVANDPSFQADVDRVIAESQKKLGPLDEAKKQEIREELMAKRLGAVASRYGLTEQEMKTLVTAKMGRVMQESAVAVQSIAADRLQSLQGELAEVERTEGRGSAHARELRDAMARLAGGAQRWAAQLHATGVTAANLFKVPPSFAEDFVKALSVVGDVLAAVVNVIPGVGQAISATYFGVKAVVGLATGDILGAFKSLLSAVPGFSGLLGAAGAAIATGAKVAQAGIAAGEGIANGDPLAFVGAVSAAAGQLGVDLGKTVAGALPGQLRAVGEKALADGLDAIGAGPAAQVFRDTAAQVGQLVAAVEGGDVFAVGRAMAGWMPQLLGHEASRAVADVAEQAQDLLDRARGSAARGKPLVAEAQRLLAQVAALQTHAGALRQFEDAAAALQDRGAPNWNAVGEELLALLGRR